MLAVEHSDDKMTEMLVDAGASVEAKDASGLTAFDYLMSDGEQEQKEQGGWYQKPVQQNQHSECRPAVCSGTTLVWFVCLFVCFANTDRYCVVGMQN
jgi:hypothetical protein